MKYQRLLAYINQMPLAILESKWAEIRGFLQAKADGAMFSQEEILAVTGGRRDRSSEAHMFGSVAVIPVVGVLSKRMNMLEDISSPGGTSTEVLTQQIRAALADPAVKSITLDINSPGGSVFGIPELGAEIAAARTQKPITAVINPMAASAAYWLASQATEVVSTPSGTAGSIGVFMAHDDISGMQTRTGIKTTLISAGKYKTEGNIFEPLTADAIVHFQNQVDEIYAMFVKAVASGRSVTQKAVKEQMGQGRMLLAGEALRAGMVDRIATLEETLTRMNNPSYSRGAKVQDFAAFKEARTPGLSQREENLFAALEREIEEQAQIQAWIEEQRLLRELRAIWN